MLFIGLLLSTLFIIIVYKLSYRRTNKDILLLENKRLNVFVLSVGDGDGFKYIHVPYLNIRKYTKEHIVSARLAGIDAPEVRYFHKKAQPYSKEAKDYLKELILSKNIKIKILKKDIYNRTLCLVNKNGIVNVEMVRKGLATVYTGRLACYGGIEKELRMAEDLARKNKIGIWSLSNFTNPQTYKKISF